MERIDLIDRLLPAPSHTLVVETPKGELILVSTERKPKRGDTVFVDEAFKKYRRGAAITGVAYCVISFL